VLGKGCNLLLQNYIAVKSDFPKTVDETMIIKLAMMNLEEDSIGQHQGILDTQNSLLQHQRRVQTGRLRQSLIVF
jgi:hypothetical protein